MLCHSTLTTREWRMWRHEKLWWGCYDLMEMVSGNGVSKVHVLVSDLGFHSFRPFVEQAGCSRWMFTMTGRPDLIWYFIRTKTEHFNKKLNQTCLNTKMCILLLMVSRCNQIGTRPFSSETVTKGSETVLVPVLDLSQATKLFGDVHPVPPHATGRLTTTNQQCPAGRTRCSWIEAVCLKKGSFP